MIVQRTAIKGNAHTAKAKTNKGTEVTLGIKIVFNDAIYIADDSLMGQGLIGNILGVGDATTQARTSARMTM